MISDHGPDCCPGRSPSVPHGPCAGACSCRALRHQLALSGSDFGSLAVVLSARQQAMCAAVTWPRGDLNSGAPAVRPVQSIPVQWPVSPLTCTFAAPGLLPPVDNSSPFQPACCHGCCHGLAEQLCRIAQPVARNTDAEGAVRHSPLREEGAAARAGKAEQPGLGGGVRLVRVRCGSRSRFRAAGRDGGTLGGLGSPRPSRSRGAHAPGCELPWQA